MVYKGFGDLFSAAASVNNFDALVRPVVCLQSGVTIQQVPKE